jgi:hypothetical protein
MKTMASPALEARAVSTSVEGGLRGKEVRTSGHMPVNVTVL